MLFWQGQGWIVLPLVFAVSLATELLTETITGGDTYYQNADSPFHLRLSSLEPSAGRWDAARMKASRPLRHSKSKNRRGGRYRTQDSHVHVYPARVLGANPVLRSAVAGSAGSSAPSSSQRS